MPVKSKILLASSSKYKNLLLSRLNLVFDTIEPNIDESSMIDELPSCLVKRLAIAKANKIATNHKDKWVIGCDQIAVLNNEILGKPVTQSRAIKQLMKSSGKEIEFITGVALVNIVSNKTYYENSVVKVKFLVLTESQIKNYLESDQPFDCAGSFKVESLGISLFEWVKSDDPSSLEGLPLITLCKLLRQAGIDPLA